MTTLKYKNYFELLDVTENSTDMEIKKAYFTKIRQYSNEKFPEEFQILTKAYQTLSNPEEKEAYIKSLKVGGNPDELLREVHHHMSEDNFFKAKELLKKLFDNGYNDDIAVISDYLECSMETGDLTLTKKLVAILESDFQVHLRHGIFLSIITLKRKIITNVFCLHKKHLIMIHQMICFWSYLILSISILIKIMP